MASRQVTASSSQSGFTYAVGTASAAGNLSTDIQMSNNPAVSLASSALGALIGTTIGGQTVGPLEVWADGAVWDTTNSKFLRPGIDFDVSLLHRSGMGT